MNKLFGVFVIVNCDLVYIWLILEIVIDEKVFVVIVNDILDERIFKLLKENDIKIVYRLFIFIIENVKVVEEFGIDVYVVIGFDEGGMVLEWVIGIFLIVLMIVDVINIFVMVVGGIGDVRGVCVVFVLGVEGVFVGSVFILIKENLVVENVK